MKKTKDIISKIIAGIGFLGILYFMAPIVLFRLINIGNLTGIVLCACIMTYGIKRDQIHSFCKKAWKHKIGKKVCIVIVTLVSVIIFIAGIATGAMIHAATSVPDEDATLIVLGCRAHGEKPSLILEERLNAAYKYMEKYPDAKCILSGGQGQDETISEAECMYRYLTKKGINSDRLFLEDKSTSTRENMAFSKQIIEEQKFSYNVAVVTNEFHEYRAISIAKKEGLDAKAIPAFTAWWLFPTYYIRELYGIVYEFIW